MTVVDAVVERVRGLFSRVVRSPWLATLMGDLILHRVVTMAYEALVQRRDSYSFDDVWNEEFAGPDEAPPPDDVTHYFRAYSFPYDVPHTFDYATHDFEGFQSWHVFSSRRVKR